MNADALETLKRSAAIPSLPQVVTRFLEVIRDPAFDFDEVADVLSADPGMTADMLRLVNSPLFGVTRTVSSLHQALALLGLRRVRSLVLGRYLVPLDLPAPRFQIPANSGRTVQEQTARIEPDTEATPYDRTFPAPAPRYFMTAA